MKVLLLLIVILTNNLVNGNVENLSFLKQLKELPNVTEFLYEIVTNLTLHSETSLCGNQLLYWLGQLETNREMWAVKMFDSWGSAPSGILSGSSYSFGSFDECLSINEKTESGTIKGQYCLQPINLPSFIGTNGVSLKIGICVPDQCSPEIIKKVTDAILLEFKLPVYDYDPNQNCQTYDQINEMKFSVIDYAAMLLFTIVLLLVMSSTAYDLTTKFYTKTAPKPIWLSFSVYTNGLTLFAMKECESSNVLGCLNGIRVLTILWVILTHNYLVKVSMPLINTSELSEWMKHPETMIILSASVAVDTFLTISGILVTWCELNRRKFSSSKKLNIPLMYIHRYLRLTPALAALILFTVTLNRYMGSGPLWMETTNSILSRSCEKYWWSALLYIQNYVNPSEMCLGHSWYLSVDMQLFILSPIILYPLWKLGKKFVWIVALLAFLSMAWSFSTFLSHHFQLNVVKRGGYAGNADQMRLIYKPTHTRMGAWLIGAICGYFLHIYKDTKIVLSKTVITTGWIISLATILAIIFGQYNIQQRDHISNEIEDAFYDSCSRVCWAIAVCWIIFACVQGYGGCVNWFLSLKEWQPLGRLSYCMYLTHVVIQVNLVSAIRRSSYFSDISVVHSFWGDIGYTLTISIAWCLMFELPVTVVERELFNNSAPVQKSTPESIDLEKNRKCNKKCVN